MKHCEKRTRQYFQSDIDHPVDDPLLAYYLGLTVGAVVDVQYSIDCVGIHLPYLVCNLFYVIDNQTVIMIEISVIEHLDHLGNLLEVGDHVLIRVPQSDSSYLHGIIKMIKDDNYFGLHDYLVEYVNDRLYCNVPWYKMQKGSDDIRFTSKPSKVWCHSDRLVKLLPKYFDN